MELVPWKRLHRAMRIADTLEEASKKILAQKKALLAQGDAALEPQVGEGKDIMSVLRTYPRSQHPLIRFLH